MKFYLKANNTQLDELKSLRQMAEDMPDKNFRFDLKSDAFFDGSALEFLIGLANKPLKNVIVFIDSRDAKFKPNYYILNGTNLFYVKRDVTDEEIDIFTLDDYDYNKGRTAVFVRVSEDIAMIDPYGYH